MNLLKHQKIRIIGFLINFFESIVNFASFFKIGDDREEYNLSDEFKSFTDNTLDITYQL